MIHGRVGEGSWMVSEQLAMMESIADPEIDARFEHRLHRR